MGITATSVGIAKRALKHIGLDVFQGLRVCELGNAHITDDAVPYRTGKEWILAKGAVEHVSIDMNGEDGAEPLNLNFPIDRWSNYFDMLTSFGTIEHVENQYQGFKNIHNLVRPGGLFVYSVPDVNSYPKKIVMPKEGNPRWLSKYCPWKYRNRFFVELAKSNDYNIVFVELLKKKDVDSHVRMVVGAVLVKVGSKEFMTEHQFYQLRGLHRRT